MRHGMKTANFGCASGGLRSAGRSSIWSESGELLVRLDDAGSGIAVVSEMPDDRSIFVKMAMLRWTRRKAEVGPS